MPARLKQEDFIIRASQIHNNFYDYSKSVYISAHKKIIIICPTHGEFLQAPISHTAQKQGCLKCANEKTSLRCRKTKDNFINQCIKIHGDFYDYSKFEYIGAHNKSTIVCPNHGPFLQDANAHLKGHKCSKCSKEQSDRWGWSKNKWIKLAGERANLYVARVYNEYEDFIKIGITKKKPKYRLVQLPYEFEVLKTITDIPEKIWELENKIKRDYRRKYKYLPKISFKGMYECYQKDILNQITYE